MLNLPVSDETHARAVELQELLGVGSDDVVGLALAALSMYVAAHRGDDVTREPVLTDSDLTAALDLLSVHGGRWLEVVHYGARASTQLATLERQS